MSRIVLLLLSLAGVLAAVLALELLAGPEPPEEASAAAPPPPPAAPAGTAAEAAAEAGDALAALEQTLLARPLFSQGRRPSAVAADAPAGAGAAAELPRLAGVIVGPDGRRAIFAPAEGPPLVVQEGGSVGGFVVRAIAPGQVTLSDDDREQIIRPSHAKETPP